MMRVGGVFDQRFCCVRVFACVLFSVSLFNFGLPGQVVYVSLHGYSCTTLSIDYNTLWCARKAALKKQH